MTSIKFRPRISSYYIGVISAITLSLFVIFLLVNFGKLNNLHVYGFDDAFITYRYAQHFFEGKGIVYNSGDYVEGYSNFLYLLLMTPAFLFSLDGVYQYSVFLNGVFLIITLCTFCYFLNKQCQFKSPQVLLGCWLLALNPAILEHTVSGLETIISLAIVIGCWIAIEMVLIAPTKARKNVLFVLIFFSILNRVDGFILPLSLVLYAFIQKEKQLAFELFGFIVVMMLIYTFWRYTYYQDVIANTYYAKVAGPLFLRIKSGLNYFLLSSIRTGFWLPLCFIFVKMIRTMMTRSYSQYRFDFATLFILVWSFYIIVIGGDCYKDRFLVPLLPLGCYIVLSSLTPFFSKETPSKILFTIVLGLFVIQSTSLRYDKIFRLSLHKKDIAIATGKFLGKKYPDATLAVLPAGKIPFFSGLKTIDMLGLNDKHIGKMQVNSKKFAAGHMKYDPDYVLSKEPTLILDWIDTDLNLEFGITKEKYQSKYHLKYLVNLAGSEKNMPYLIDVSRYSFKQIHYLISVKRYFCAILLKNNS